MKMKEQKKDKILILVLGAAWIASWVIPAAIWTLARWRLGFVRIVVIIIVVIVIIVIVCIVAMCSSSCIVAVCSSSCIVAVRSSCLSGCSGWPRPPGCPCCGWSRPPGCYIRVIVLFRTFFTTLWRLRTFYSFWTFWTFWTFNTFAGRILDAVTCADETTARGKRASITMTKLKNIHVVPFREPDIKNAEISTVKIFSHIRWGLGCASSVPADVGPGPPVPASLAAPHISSINYEGPIASVATFGVSVDAACT